MAEPVYRVLVVDDMEEVRVVIEDAFKRAGHKTESARDGQAAANLLAIYQYDLVILDLAMPKINGHKLAQDILAKPNPPLVIICTGVVEPRLVKDLILRGVGDIVTKPFSTILLVSKSVALLERRVAESAMGGDAAKTPEALARNIALARSALQQQLSSVTSSFQDTIDQLQKQQDEMEAGMMGSVRLFTSLLGKVGNTGTSHGGRVERIAQLVGEKLGLPSENLRELKLAALLHDIGQFGMPDDVRTASARNLRPEQRKIYELYPVLGAALLAEVSGLQRVSAIILAHCENFDGTGFPNGLRGEEIPIESRILHIADGVDTAYMYRHTGRPIEEIRDHLNEQRGLAYEPALVNFTMPVLSLIYRTLSGKPIPTPASQLAIGQQLAEDVYDSQGHFLARSGAPVTQQLRDHLVRFLGDQPVHIHPPESPDDTEDNGPPS